MDRMAIGYFINNGGRMKQVKQLSDTIINRIGQLSKELQGLINTGAEVRVWEGKKTKMNPSTGEILGEVPTANLDVAVNADVVGTVTKALESIKDSQHYIEVEVKGTKLVAIASRHDETNNRYIVQFTKPNTGSWTTANEDAFNSKFAEVFGKTATVTTHAKPVAAAEEVPF